MVLFQDLENPLLLLLFGFRKQHVVLEGFLGRALRNYMLCLDHELACLRVVDDDDLR